MIVDKFTQLMALMLHGPVHLDYMPQLLLLVRVYSHRLVVITRALEAIITRSTSTSDALSVHGHILSNPIESCIHKEVGLPTQAALGIA